VWVAEAHVAVLPQVPGREVIGGVVGRVRIAMPTILNPWLK
jgi:hypothetical protein